MLAGRLRLASGLTLFAFLTCHLLNHAFGLASIDAMSRAHALLLGPWRTLPGTVLLASALVTHLGCAVRAIYRRRTLRLPPWEWLQLGLGLILPWLILEHVLNTRIAELALGTTPSYARVIAVLWIAAPPRGLWQAVAVVVAWGHGCVGLYLWLRTKAGFPRWRWWLAPLALLLPTLALAGYVAAGFEMREELGYPQRLVTLLQPPPAVAARLQDWALTGYALLATLLATPFLGRGLRRAAVRWRGLPRLILGDGRRLPIVPGASVLEVLRSYGVPHASVCGGRARCTTCRVQVLQGAEALPAPSGDEAAALARIHAPPGVRLACQIRPQHDLAIAALLPPGARAADGRAPGGLEGREQTVTCMFVDLRDSTRLGEGKLPYDVLFVLNQFFAEMTQALAATRGHYAQFTGDGLMALYGLESDDDPRRGARDAIRGAGEMLARLERLNRTLASELEQPLRIGIGIHFGVAIVGAMGPPGAQMRSAIGDTINTAARLESLSKQFGAPLVLSQEVVTAAGLELPAARREQMQVSGRQGEVTVYLLERAPQLNAG